MEATILVDRRRVQAEECLSLEETLRGAELSEYKGAWFLMCRCCEGGTHFWSPSGHGVDPNGGNYQCGPCCGRGCFRVELP